MLAILLSTLALAATAADPTPTSPGASGAAAEPAKSANDAKRSELVCHNEKPTGSHMIERVCTTREVADKEEQAAQGAMNSINRRTKAAANPPK